MTNDRRPRRSLPVSARQLKLRMPVRAVGPKRAKARIIILAHRPLRVPIPASVTMLAVAACIPLALVLLVLGADMSERAVRVVAHAPGIEELAWRHLVGNYLVKETAVLAALALLSQPMLTHDCPVSRNGKVRRISNHHLSIHKLYVDIKLAVRHRTLVVQTCNDPFRGPSGMQRRGGTF